ERAVLEARAADAVADMNVIRVAVLQYQAEHHVFPREKNRGRIPDGLDRFLPEGFRFAQDDFVLDYENWSGSKNGFVGVTVVTSEPDLGRAMLALLGRTGTWSNGADKVSWVIEWS
ncbi:MAG TPA: hypothetical protein VE173_14865, partial [Longimicrobiales bacterium]|nr:hypothetical protein [Longimicrobiales bacterium]